MVTGAFSLLQVLGLPSIFSLSCITGLSPIFCLSSWLSSVLSARPMLMDAVLASGACSDSMLPGIVIVPIPVFILIVACPCVSALAGSTVS